MKKYAIIAGVVALSATLFSNVFASAYFLYQPKTPNCMK